MPAFDVGAQPTGHLNCYGHALGGQAVWVREWPLREDTPVRDAALPPRLVLVGPYAGTAELWLPARHGASTFQAEQLAWAATAHAAAHVQYGQAAQPRAGLKPLQIILLAMLEDARVEHAMLQTCPGLRELWVPQHTVTHANSHNGFDALLARLSLSLLNPAYADPHPWIARVRASLLDPEGLCWQVDTFQGLRALASVLGHEVGQLRLPFDARTFAGAAPYRDDNQHLWLPDEVADPASPTNATDTPDPVKAAAAEAQRPPGRAVHYPEWDHRIGRLRPGWCRVVVRDTPAPTSAQTVASCQVSPAARRLAHGLALQNAVLRVSAGRSDEGQHLHPMAVVDAHLDRLRGLTPDLRVFRGERRTPQPLAVWVLLDTSLSMQARAAHMYKLAWNAVNALDLLGHRTALWTLSSEGRHQVGMACLKNWSGAMPPHEPADITCSGSSRLGAGVRHGLAEHTNDARTQPGWRRLVIIVTDGELHDIDVHDPVYLYGDLAHCRAEAMHRQVTLRGLLNSADKASRFRSVVGPGNCAVATSDRGLPAVLKTLLAR